MKIVNKISNLFFISAVIVVFIVTIIFYYISKNYIQDEILTRLNSIATLKAKNIQLILTRYIEQVEFLASLDEVENAVVGPTKSVENINNLLYEIKKKNEYGDFYKAIILNPEGKVIASSDRNSIGEDKNLGLNNDNLKNNVYISEMYIPKNENFPIIDISTPIKDDVKGGLLGIMVVGIKMGKFYEVTLDRSDLGNTGEVYLVNKNGYLISPSRFIKDAVLKLKINTINFENCLKYKSSFSGSSKDSVIFYDYRHVLTLGTHVYIPVAKWCLLAEIDESEAFQPLAQIRYVFLIVMLVILILTLSLIRLISKLISDPIQNLRHGVEMVEKGNLSYKVGTNSKDEIGQLSRAFDKMTETLNKKTTSIDLLTYEMEKRKKTELELKKSKDYAELLYKISPSAIFTIDLDCNVTSWNDKAAEITGYKAEEIMGKHCLTFADMPCKEECMLYSNNIYGSIVGIEAKIRRKDGIILTVLKNIDPLKDENGKIAGGIESFIDITERKKNEEEISKLSQAIRQSPATVVITDLSGNIEYVNPRFTAITGYSFSEVKGKNPKILKTDFHSGDYYKELWEAITSGKEWRGEFRNRRKNGEFYWELASISSVRNKNGDVINFIKVSEDITGRKESERKLKEALEIKTNFTSMVSHELRTPLTAIKEGINLVCDGSSGQVNREQKEFLEIAKRNVDRLARLINDVLDFQKLEAGKIDFNMQENNINEVVIEVERIMAPLSKDKNLNLLIYLDKNLPKIKFDKDKIIQVLTNIVNNSIKFTEKGSIKITTNRYEGFINVVVEDTGIGVKEEDKARLFHSFEQLAKEKERIPGGTGLGLAISKSIIDKHNGKIWAESEVGKGTKFHFTLPII